MNRLDPEKLHVEYREGVTSTNPVIPRRYTLTHSDLTADLYLTIGREYAYDKVTNLRDEVLGEWMECQNRYFFYVYLMIDKDRGVSAIRNYVFRKELPLALEAIRYGDDRFFRAHIELNYVPILVFFQSKNPKYNTVENWGYFSRYEIEY